MGSKVWVSFSRITFQSLFEEIAKHYCLASSAHLSITYFNWCTIRRTHVPHKVTRSTKLQGLWRSSELALRSTEFRATENLIFPALSVTQHISGTVKHVIIIFGTIVLNDDISSFFFSFFKNFRFLGSLWGKRAKNCPKWKIITSVTCHISGTV